MRVRLVTLVGILACLFLWTSTHALRDSCPDADADGVCADVDCDDSNHYCALDCTDSDVDGICDDLDNCPHAYNPNQLVTTRLNGPMVLNGTIVYFALSADSRYVVYKADQDVDGVDELYSAPMFGAGVATKLNPPLVSGGEVAFYGYVLSPDGSTVVYLADQEVDQRYELYSVPVGGGVVTKLNPPLGPDTDVREHFQVTPDGGTVVYTADQDVDNMFEIYGVPIGGGESRKLNAPLASDRDVEKGFVVSPDGAFVVYTANTNGPYGHEIYSVPIGGGEAVKLNHPIGSSGDVWNPVVSPDSSTVVYNFAGMGVLYSVPIGGGSQIELSREFDFLGRVKFGHVVSPDSMTVVYRGDLIQFNRIDLFSVPIHGGEQIKLNGPFVSSADVEAFELSPDGSTVVFQDSRDGLSGDELYAVSIVGGPLTTLVGPAGNNGGVQDFRVSRDGSTVVYLADQDVHSKEELYSVPIGGGKVTKLNHPLGPSWYESVRSYLLSPDSSTVLYTVRLSGGGEELSRVPIGGGTSYRLHEWITPGGSSIYIRFGISPDSATAVYSAPQETPETRELYSVNLAVDDDGIDGDYDGWGGACDCDDARPLCDSDCTDDDEDGSCPPHDCDDANPGCTTDCTDIDMDGYCPPHDCDDGNPDCVLDCSDPDGDGLAVCEGDCDPFNPWCGLDCTDADADGYCVTTDCDEDDGDTYPDAPESNDGVDNHCPGYPGYGIVDEISGPAGFHDSQDQSSFCWTAQAGATAYEVVRSEDPVFPTGCTVMRTHQTCVEDSETPQSLTVFHYLVRALVPHVGSWGLGVSGAERSNICP